MKRRRDTTGEEEGGVKRCTQANGRSEKEERNSGKRKRECREKRERR